jgi:hypothetical protein
MCTSIVDMAAIMVKSKHDLFYEILRSIQINKIIKIINKRMVIKIDETAISIKSLP